MDKEAGLREPLRKITNGFYILTTRKDQEEMSTRDKDYLAAGTVSWVSQVSFEPPMVMVAIMQQTDLHETVEKSRIFALNILSKAQKEMIPEFARETQIDQAQKTLNGHAYENKKTGAPILKEVPAYLECEVTDQITTGDHAIYIGKVVHHEIRNEDAEPLMEWETEYHYGG